MVLVPTMARSIGRHGLRISKPRLPEFSNSYLIPETTSFTRQWQFQTRRSFILESISESVKLRRLSDSDSGIIVLNLDRPGAKNAIGKDMLKGLQHSFETVNRDPSANVMMLCSSVPKVFCAGADLKERKTMIPSEVRSFVSSLRSTFTLLEELPIPTIAVIEGVALGGGLEMALSCDIRICEIDLPDVDLPAEDSTMGLPETGLAIIPGAGGTQRLPRLVGKSIAKELIFTGRRVGGRDAVSLGIVSYCSPPGEAQFKAIEIAREINEKGPLAVRMAKRAINEGFEIDMASALALEEECYDKLLNTKDRLEGLAAFAEKRKPRYNGD